MRWLSLVVLVAACGRYSFAPIGGTSGDDAGGSGDDAGSGSETPDSGPLGGDVVMHFGFESNRVEDVSGVEATCNGGCPGYVVGRGTGLAAAHFGAAECLALPDTAAQHVDQLTISIWVRYSGPNGRTVFGKPMDATDHTWEIWMDGSQHYVWSIFDSGFQEELHCVTATVDTGWHHVAATFGGTTGVIYVDGAACGTVSDWDALIYGTQDVRIGCIHESGADIEKLDGDIDDITVYDRVLSAAEIAALAAN